MTTSTSPDRMPVDDLAGLGVGEEPAEHLDPHRVAGEAVAEGLEVLLGQQGGRHQHRGLVAVLHRLEHGPERDLGLAEADVAADEAVHRDGQLHVGLDLVDGGALVGCRLVRERLLELALPGRVGREGVARRVDALLVEHDQLLGDLGHRRAHLGLGLLPLAPAHAAERGRLAAGVVADGVDLVGRHVEPVVAAVLEQQVVALDPADGPLDHAAVAGDAVLVVHDVVARLEVVEEPGRLAASGPGPTVGPPPAGDVGLGQHGQLHRRQQEAPLERLHDDGAARRGEVVGRPRRRAARCTPSSPSSVSSRSAVPAPSAATTTR